MVKFLIHRPTGVIMAFIALIIMGIYATVLLPISLLPDIKIPEITIRVSNPGMPAAEMEQSITQVIRMQLVQISGIKDLESESRDGESTITLGFDYGKDIDLLFMEVNEKVDLAMAGLPREIPRPRVIKASATDLPVFNINIAYNNTSKTDKTDQLELSQLVEKVIRKRFEQLPNVALADITGTLSPQILITPSKAKMAALGVTDQQIELAIMQSMVGHGSIRYREGQLVFDVIIEQKITHPSDIADIPIKSGERIFKIGELATVQMQPARVQGIYQFNGQPAICMPIIKSANARMGDLKKDVTELVNILEKEYPQLNFTISNDQTHVLSFAISNLKNSLIVGIILAISVLFLFLGDYRSPLLMGVTIPTSLIISMIVFYLVGISLNIVSLSGLILGVGMMVDNSIIVIDSITLWRARGNELETSVIKATNEMITPLLSSMLTTCAVFIPLIFLSGIAGAMFFDQAIAIVSGLGVSFMVSITLIPTLYYRIHLKKAHNWQQRKAIIPLEENYKKSYNYVFRNWKKVALFTLLLLVAFPFMFIHMEKSQMPELTRNEVVVNLSWGGNISLEENTKRCTRILNHTKNQIAQSAFYLGRQQLLLTRGMDMNESDASLYFTMDQGVELEQFKKDIDTYISQQYPGTALAFSYPESAFERIFPAGEAGLTVKVSSGESGILPTVALTDSLAKSITTDFPDVHIEQVPTQSQLFLEFDNHAITLYNTSVNAIQRNLQVAFQSSNIGVLAFEQQVIPIVFGDSIQSIDKVLGETFVKTQKEIDIPIRNLVNQKSETVYRSIHGDNANTYIPLKIYGPTRSLEQIHNQLKTQRAQSSYSLSFTGEIFRSKALIWELFGVLLMSVLLLYFILAAQFESVFQPLIILFELPVDIGLALMVLWIFGGSINLMSMIGLIVMGGVVVNDSILKIDAINRLRKQGVNLHDAITEGGDRRLKSIVTTSLTTILALVPILFGSDLGSELQRPMAITLIAGMIIGILVSLYIVPLIYWVAYRKKDV